MFNPFRRKPTQVEIEAGDLEHAEDRWRETQQDDEDMAEVRRKLAYADDAKMELEARLTGIRRLSKIRRPLEE